MARDQPCELLVVSCVVADSPKSINCKIREKRNIVEFRGEEVKR